MGLRVSFTLLALLATFVWTIEANELTLERRQRGNSGPTTLGGFKSYSSSNRAGNDELDEAFDVEELDHYDSSSRSLLVSGVAWPESRGLLDQYPIAPWSRFAIPIIGVKSGTYPVTNKITFKPNKDKKLLTDYWLYKGFYKNQAEIELHFGQGKDYSVLHFENHDNCCKLVFAFAVRVCKAGYGNCKGGPDAFVSWPHPNLDKEGFSVENVNNCESDRDFKGCVAWQTSFRPVVNDAIGWVTSAAGGSVFLREYTW
jgi:hypothetical protein